MSASGSLQRPRRPAPALCLAEFRGWYTELENLRRSFGDGIPNWKIFGQATDPRPWGWYIVPEIPQIWVDGYTVAAATSTSTIDHR